MPIINRNARPNNNQLLTIYQGVHITYFMGVMVIFVPPVPTQEWVQASLKYERICQGTLLFVYNNCAVSITTAYKSALVKYLIIWSLSTNTRALTSDKCPATVWLNTASSFPALTVKWLDSSLDAKWLGFEPVTSVNNFKLRKWRIIQEIGSSNSQGRGVYHQISEVNWSCTHFRLSKFVILGLFQGS